jgi:hypothetical protein
MTGNTRGLAKYPFRKAQELVTSPTIGRRYVFPNGDTVMFRAEESSRYARDYYYMARGKVFWEGNEGTATMRFITVETECDYDDDASHAEAVKVAQQCAKMMQWQLSMMAEGGKRQPPEVRIKTWKMFDEGNVVEVPLDDAEEAVTTDEFAREETE